MASCNTSEYSSFENQKIEIPFGMSNKGNPPIICNNYLFGCNKTTLSKKYWECTERTCGVYIHTSLDNELICTNIVHNHSSNLDQIEAKLLQGEMKKQTLSETAPIAKIMMKKS